MWHPKCFSHRREETKNYRQSLSPLPEFAAKVTVKTIIASNFKWNHHQPITFQPLDHCHYTPLKHAPLVWVTVGVRHHLIHCCWSFPSLALHHIHADLSGLLSIDHVRVALTMSVTWIWPISSIGAAWRTRFMSRWSARHLVQLPESTGSIYFLCLNSLVQFGSLQIIS